MEVKITMIAKVVDNRAQMEIQIDQIKPTEQKTVFHSVGKSDPLPIEQIRNYENAQLQNLSAMAKQMLSEDGMFTEIQNLIS